MKHAAKVSVVIFCLALCVGAPFLLPKQAATSSAPKTQVAPVSNRQPPRANWIRA